MTIHGLKPHHANTLDAVHAFIAQYGRGPTNQQLYARLDYCSPSSINMHLASLERLGWLYRASHNLDPEHPGTITVTGRAWPPAGVA